MVQLGRPPKYPWTVWLDGEEHVIQKGVDFEQPAVNFQTSLHVKARMKGIKVTTAIDGDKITFRFYAPAPPAEAR